MFFVNYIPEFLYQPLELSNVRPTDFANSKHAHLDIIAQCNLKITNYLDITLNLNDASYRPYRKPNEETNYIHVNSEHLPSIIIKKFNDQLKKTLNFVIIKKYF